ncbi:MAG: hypothetical protein KGQ41_02405 [Alphaproteobacteria bacterium]|nr:hypothetical protein [Alphaproteobacteria bacterium]
MAKSVAANLRALDEATMTIGENTNASQGLISRPSLHLIFMEASDKGLLTQRNTRIAEATLSHMTAATLPIATLDPEMQKLAQDSAAKCVLLDTLLGVSETRRLAFFSDVDNTLGNFEPGVHSGFEPDHHLSAILARLSDTIDGRFSFVTGRPDLFLSNAFSNVNGFRASEFGAVVTHWDIDEGAYPLNEPINPDYTELDAAFARVMAENPTVFEGCFVEEAKVTARTVALTGKKDAAKQAAAIALLKPVAEQFVAEYNAQNPSRFPLVAHVNDAVYNCTLEVTPENLGDKLRCIRTLMVQPALRDVLPVAMGDSGPDGPMLDCARERGGISISVGSKLPSLGYNATANLAAPEDLQLVLEAFVWAKANNFPVDRSDRLNKLRYGTSGLPANTNARQTRAVLRPIRAIA